jgi:hypothetical protein
MKLKQVARARSEAERAAAAAALKAEIDFRHAIDSRYLTPEI